jgi:hypothetical protein
VSAEEVNVQWFLAIDAATGSLLLSLEAASVGQAKTRFVEVAPLVGIALASLGQGVLCVPMAEPLDGLPTFRNAYFAAMGEPMLEKQNAPSSTTLQ